MRLRQRGTLQAKTKLSATLHNWLPILQSGLEELEEALRRYEIENPCLEIRSGFEKRVENRAAPPREWGLPSGGVADVIEAMTVDEPSLYEILLDQIDAPLFPTPKSRSIAEAIVRQIDEEGYFDGSVKAIAHELGVTPQEVERIRQRFAHLEPAGVGAKDAAEALRFQLQQSDIQEPLYSHVAKMLERFEEIGTFRDEPYYDAAMAVIRRFRLPPALETMEASPPVVPELIVKVGEEGIDVAINDLFYPDIHIVDPGVDHKFVRQKLKEARDLVDALQMRRATLYKIGLMIVEFQYDFFHGGQMRPMRLVDIAEEFDHSPSTISRAIANKYLMCDRGIFAMKSFFTTGLDEEVSNATIKAYIAELIAKEDRERPYSDQKLADLVQARFGVKLVRRTVTKYRKQMQIGGSGERKKFYRLA